MPVNAAWLIVMLFEDSRAAACAVRTGLGNGSLTVTVCNAGSTVMTKASTTGTDWTPAVSRKPRPNRGSSQPSTIVSTPTVAVNANARGLATADTATPGFQAKKIALPNAAM